MPNLEQAKKALRQNEKRKARNLQYKNWVKKLYRELHDLTNEGKREEAAQKLPAYFKAVDKATKKNIFHKNTASRKKSVMARQVNKKSVQQTVPDN